MQKKRIRLESSKYTTICASNEELKDRNIVLRIAGGVRKKEKSATYLGMALTSKGIASSLNEDRERKSISKTKWLAEAAKMDTKGPRKRLSYILETYLRSAYTFNAILIPSVTSLQKLDWEIIKTLLSTLLKSKE